MRHASKRAIAALVMSILSATAAQASCGSSSCPIEIHPLQGGDTGRFSLDLSFQFIDQNQPRIGTRRAAVGEIPSDHDELRTINRLAFLQFGYTVSQRVQLSLTAPYVSRFHKHFDTETQQNEQWSFGAPGDAVLQGRFRIASQETVQHGSLWLSAGLKLPTGARGEKNDAGEDAEVTLTPGTGSVDALAGLTYQSGFLRDTSVTGLLGHTTLIPFFASVNLRVNGRGTHDYRRGREVLLNSGTEYPIGSHVHLLVQLNARFLAKDDPGQTGEDRQLTGGRFLFASPGLRFVMHGGTSVYAFVQIPLYQRVNGLQLTARANYLAGIHQTF